MQEFYNKNYVSWIDPVSKMKPIYNDPNCSLWQLKSVYQEYDDIPCFIMELTEGHIKPRCVVSNEQGAMEGTNRLIVNKDVESTLNDFQSSVWHVQYKK